MGGHGALVCSLKVPGLYRSVSAFAPICNPSQCPWGDKAFSGYLGSSAKDKWRQYDAVELIRSGCRFPCSVLVDQGAGDNFLAQKQLLPDELRKICSEKGVAVEIRMQEVRFCAQADGG